MLVVFTDLDGTLLAEDTYSFEAAQPALDRLAELGMPCVIVTSKTRAEVEALRIRLRNRHPFVVENGGAAFIPRGYFPFRIEGAVSRDGYEVLEFGTRYAVIAKALDEASAETGCAVRAFHALSDAEVGELCGLDLAAARLARMREYDEPFSIAGQDRTNALLVALEQRGLRWTRGGRFHHAMGGSGKGQAVAALLALFRRAHPGLVSAGLGDSPNDLEFLRLVDEAVIVRSHHSQADLVRQTGGVLTRERGPRGWNGAVTGLIRRQR
jgi:mannosyl-3-phosphoglycerate phosphatase